MRTVLLVEQLVNALYSKLAAATVICTLHCMYNSFYGSLQIANIKLICSCHNNFMFIEQFVIQNCYTSNQLLYAYIE